MEQLAQLSKHLRHSPVCYLASNYRFGFSHFLDLILPQNHTVWNTLLELDLADPSNVTNGNSFIIENCGQATLGVLTVTYSFQNAAIQAYSDSQLGPSSSQHGFTAMFKSDDVKQLVGLILNAIFFYKGKQGLEPEPKKLSPPRLACVTQDTAHIYKNLKLDHNPYQRCLTAQSDAYYVEGTSYIFMCPSFNLLPPMPTINRCPTLDGNSFAGDPNAIYKSYQSYTLLIEVIRFYLGRNALDRFSDPPETIDWNACIRLGATYSVLNPSNYQLYSSCKPTVVLDAR